MKRLIPALSLAIAGCMAASKIRETTPVEPLGRYAVVHVVMACEDPEASAAVDPLRGALVSKMTERGVFSSYVTGDQPLNAELRLTVRIVGQRSVSETTRFFFGAMAGKAKLFARVDLVDLKSGAEVGSFTVEGKSSGGWAAAGTNPEALDQTAAGIADHLKARK